MSSLLLGARRLRSSSQLRLKKFVLRWRKSLRGAAALAIGAIAVGAGWAQEPSAGAPSAESTHSAASFYDPAQPFDPGPGDLPLATDPEADIHHYDSHSAAAPYCEPCAPEPAPPAVPNMIGDMFFGRARMVETPGFDTLPGDTDTFSATIESTGGPGAFFSPDADLDGAIDDGEGVFLPFGAQFQAVDNNVFGQAILVPLSNTGQLTFNADGMVEDPLNANYNLLENAYVTGQLQTEVDLQLPGATVSFDNATANRTIVNGDGVSEYEVSLNYTVTEAGALVAGAPVQFWVPSANPADLAGRVKLSNNNNPLPRDRVYFDFDYFDDASLLAGGKGVRRFAPGFEKTFYDGLMSIEVRTPLAYSVDHNFMAGDAIGDDDFVYGDVVVAAKRLLVAAPKHYLSGGLGVSLPTAKDIEVGQAGVELLEIQNDTVQLMPFLAWLYVPTPRVFVQAWSHSSIALGSNDVLANVDGNGLQNVGSIEDQTLFYADASLGYWLVQNSDPRSAISGLAGVVEAHYTTDITDPDSLQAGNVLIGNPLHDAEQLNLTAGLHMPFHAGHVLTVGYSTPLLEDQSYESQYKLMWNGYY